MTPTPTIEERMSVRLGVDYLTVQDVAARHQLHEDTVYRACYSGKLKYSRAGNRLRITSAAVAKWLAGR
jgi:excisionase family DNA binding protein